VLSLALINPWVRGDGVGYYAFARALLIQHNLDFTPDYNAANASFRDARSTKTEIPSLYFTPRRIISKITSASGRQFCGLHF